MKQLQLLLIQKPIKKPRNYSFFDWLVQTAKVSVDWRASYGSLSHIKNDTEKKKKN